MNELEAFERWLVERGYKSTTAHHAALRVRRALECGLEVGGKWNRAGLRWALRRFEEFRREVS